MVDHLAYYRVSVIDVDRRMTRGPPAKEHMKSTFSKSELMVYRVRGR